MISLSIVFLLPFKNYNIIKTLIDNIKKIQKIKCRLFLNINGKVENIDKTLELKSKTEKNSEKKYFKEFNKIINEKKIEFNYLKKFDIFSYKKEFYKEFQNMNYFGKINFLEKFPIIEKYGCFSLEKECMSDLIDIYKEKELFLENFDIYKYDDIRKIDYFSSLKKNKFK